MTEQESNGLEDKRPAVLIIGGLGKLSFVFVSDLFCRQAVQVDCLAAELANELALADPRVVLYLGDDPKDDILSVLIYFS
jgi:hypothetical protein